MARQFFSGNSLEQAVMSAARHYELAPERLAYTVREKKTGFVNSRRKVVIVVDPDQPEISGADEATVIDDGPKGESLSGAGIARAAKIEAQQRDEEPTATRPSSERDRVDLEESADDDGDEPDTDEPDTDEPDTDEPDTDEPDTDEPDTDDDSGEVDSDDDDTDDDTGEDDTDTDSRGGRGRGSRRGRGRGRRGIDRSRAIKVLEHEWVAPEEGEFDLDDSEPEVSALEIAVELILDVMDLEIEYSIEDGDPYTIEFEGEDSDLLTADDGRVLKAFEHVLPRIARSFLGETVPVRVDCDGFRADRQDELMRLAREAAASVEESGKERSLPPMNPADRRIVHMALADHPAIETVSEGRGFMKRVAVRPIDD